ncbi:MAG: 23S rRNA (guanosine(2251)-2'-O)-methyltransferase RlmB [Pseudomonadota bacterium]
MPASRQCVYGWHSVLHFLSRAPERVLEIHRQSDRRDARAQALDDHIELLGLHVQTAGRQQLDRLAGTDGHQGVVAVIRPQSEMNEDNLSERISEEGASLFLLVLDEVQDPHNLGACLRSADGAGCHGVVVPKRRAAGLTDTVRKVACGAAEVVPLYRVTNLARALRHLGEAGVLRVATADAAGPSLFNTALPRPLALVMGGEARGVRRLTAESCDVSVSLPMHGAVSSLNVSVATGIALYEAVRQNVVIGDPPG